MKFLNVFMVGKLEPEAVASVGDAIASVVAARAPVLRGVVGRAEHAHAGRMLRVGLRIADARQHLDRAEDQAPEDEQQRQRVRAARAMPPRPDRAPHAAGRSPRRRRRVAGEPDAAPRRVRPEQPSPTPSATASVSRAIHAERVVDRRLAGAGGGRDRLRAAAAPLPAAPASPASSASSDSDASCLSILASSLSQSRSGHQLTALPRQAIALDLLVQIRARHVERARRLRHVPVELAQLGEQKRALGRVLELLERLAVEQRSQPACSGVALPDEPLDVVAP